MEGEGEVGGRCMEGTREVRRRWVIIGNLKFKAYFEQLYQL